MLIVLGIFSHIPFANSHELSYVYSFTPKVKEEAALRAQRAQRVQRVERARNLSRRKRAEIAVVATAKNQVAAARARKRRTVVSQVAAARARRRRKVATARARYVTPKYQDEKSLL